MQELTLTSVEIKNNTAVIKTIYTKKTICSLPTTDVNKAYNFAEMLETASHDIYHENDLITQELELFLNMCNGQNIDTWLKETLPQLIA